MNEPKDLDQLFESFMRDSQVEDKGFSEKVMAQVSTKPRLAFVTNIYPMLGGLAGLIIFIFAKQNLFSINLDFIPRYADVFHHEMTSASLFYSSYGNYAMMAAFALVAAYFVLQPEKN